MGKDRADEFVSIGTFGLLTGISISTLRYYHDVGLLSPAEVDPRTNYRRYATSQVATARAIRTLRSLDMAIEDISQLLKADDEESTRSLLKAHRDRLVERAQGFSRMLTLLDDLIKKGVLMSQVKGCRLMEVTLRAPDVEEVARFYREVFGVEFESETHGGGPVHVHACGGTWDPEGLFLFTIWPSRADDATKSSIAFTVDDVDAVYERAIKTGATKVSAPADNPDYPRSATFTDPADNRVTLYLA